MPGARERAAHRWETSIAFFYGNFSVLVTVHKKKKIISHTFVYGSSNNGSHAARQNMADNGRFIQPAAI